MAHTVMVIRSILSFIGEETIGPLDIFGQLLNQEANVLVFLVCTQGEHFSSD